MGTLESAGDVVGITADGLTIVVSVAAAIAAGGALTGRNVIVPTILRRVRWNTVGRALVRHGVPKRTAKRQIREVMTDRLTGRRPWTVPEELHWLDGLFGTERSPVTFCGARSSSRPGEAQDPRRLSALLADLADGYASLNGRLDSRALIAPDQVTALRQEAELAAQMAQALRESARFAFTGLDAATFSTVVHRDDLILELLETPPSYPTPWPETVALSHRRERVVPALPSAVQKAETDGVRAVVLATTAAEQSMLEARLTGRTFDGVLPSLMACRFERDASSGRGRLHLAVRECTYSSVMLASYGGDMGVGRSWTGTAEPGDSPHLLTLSLMIATTDEKLVAVLRPEAMQAGGMWVPSVNGNLEVGARFGIDEDVSETGLLDFVSAIVRETKEELGLAIEPHRVRCVGLARFHSEAERNTNILCFVAPVGMTAEQLRDAAVDADPVEGAFEVGDRLLLLPWASPRTDAPRLAEWAATSPDVAPSLTACLSALSRGYTGDEGAPALRVQPVRGASVPDGAILLTTHL